MAIEAYQNAAQLTSSHIPSERIANLFCLLGDAQAAATIWQQLTAQHAHLVHPWVELAKCQIQLGDEQGMLNSLETAISMDTFCVEAYSELHRYYKNKGFLDKAKVYSQRASYYLWIPSFCQNYLLYLRLTEQQVDFVNEASLEKTMVSMEDKYVAINELLVDKSLQSTEFLIAMCQHHNECGPVEENFFGELEQRCINDTQVIHLLQQLLRYFISTCTVQHVSSILAKRKICAILDDLVSLLPKNMGTFEMGIPEALDELGDDRAVQHLMHTVDTINKEIFSIEEEYKRATRRQKHILRNRCCLALGAFYSTSVENYLEQHLDTKSVRVSCAAALFRMTRRMSYLEQLWGFLQAKKRMSCEFRRFLKQYLVKHGDGEPLIHSCIQWIENRISASSTTSNEEI